MNKDESLARRRASRPQPPVADNLKLVLEHLDWSVAAFAEFLGLSHMAVHRWLWKEASPEWRSILIISERLGLPPHWFYEPRDHISSHDAAVLRQRMRQLEAA